MPNTDKEFEWTEANVIDFAYSVRHNDNFKDGIALSKGTIDELAKEFKQSKSPVLDYEIMSMIGQKETQWSCDKVMFDWYLKSGWKINQVKRLSDGEVFTIDEITGGNNKILDFVISNGNLIIKMSTFGFTNNSYFDTNIQSLTKNHKKPLFTTEQENEIIAIIKRWMNELL